jgi:hypothetical protein
MPLDASVAIRYDGLARSRLSSFRPREMIKSTDDTSDTSLYAGGITRMRCSALGGGSLSAGIGDQICLCLAATLMSRNSQWFPQKVVSSPTVFASNGGTKDAQS